MPENFVGGLFISRLARLSAAGLTARRSEPTLYAVRLINHANLSPEIRAALERELPGFGTLQQAVVWARAQTPPVLLVETIAQDEYTHDVIATFREGLVLIFAST